MLESEVGDDEHCEAPCMPWAEVSDGVWFKLLRAFGNDTGWVSLLRLRAGTSVGLHRHTGAVHGFVLQGARRLMDGTTCPPGSYIYEPPGNVDSWSATGDHDMVGLFVVNGVVEYLSPTGDVVMRETATTKQEKWAKFLAEDAWAR